MHLPTANDKSNAFGIYYKDTTKLSAVFLPGLSRKMYCRVSVRYTQVVQLFPKMFGYLFPLF